MAVARMRACLYALTVAAIAVGLEAHAAPAKDAAGLKAEREAVRARAERARAALAAAETQRKDATDAIARPTGRSPIAQAPGRRRAGADAARSAQALAQAAVDDATCAAGWPGAAWQARRQPQRRRSRRAAAGRRAATRRRRATVDRLAAIAARAPTRSIAGAATGSGTRFAAARSARRAHDETMKDVAREAAAVDAMRREQQAGSRACRPTSGASVSLDALAKDEARLRTLIERLARPAPPKSARPSVPPTDGHRQENQTKGFGSMRNFLMPAKGELIGRFGVPREGSGAPWRGWFIETAAGASVRAVAAGQVVWADWLRDSATS
jgi:murein DD-endopeptidase MepM/ murein hydrolase activator NlpD